MMTTAISILLRVTLHPIAIVLSITTVLGVTRCGGSNGDANWEGRGQGG